MKYDWTQKAKELGYGSLKEMFEDLFNKHGSYRLIQEYEFPDIPYSAVKAMCRHKKIHVADKKKFDWNSTTERMGYSDPEEMLRDLHKKHNTYAKIAKKIGEGVAYSTVANKMKSLGITSSSGGGSSRGGNSYYNFWKPEDEYTDETPPCKKCPNFNKSRNKDTSPCSKCGKPSYWFHNVYSKIKS